MKDVWNYTESVALFYPILLTAWRNKSSCQIFGNYVHVFWLILRLGLLLTHSFFMKQKNEYYFCMAMWFYVLHKNLSLNMQHYYTEFHRMSVVANSRDQHIGTVFVYGLFNDSVSSSDNVVLNNWITEYLIAIGYHFFKCRSQWAYMTYCRKVGITCIAAKPHKFKVLRTKI